nr:hypothetical protein [Tanacetum cinerariifolium]
GALVDLWNGEMTRALDLIAPERPRPSRRVRAAPWFTEELRTMKRQGRCLERRWRKTCADSDRARARAHFRVYSVAVAAAKKAFFSAG